FIFDHEVKGSFAQKLDEVLALDNNSIITTGIAAAESIKDQLEYETVYLQKMRTLSAIDKSKKIQHFPFARPLHIPAKSLTADSSNPLLSVVVPYYNMHLYIDDCIDSLLKTDYDQFEIIIVDDGSTDPATVSALEKWKDHPKVKVYQKENEGLAFTRNFGASKAKGSYLAFLDADDTVSTTYYSKAIRVLKTYDDVSFVGSWVQFFGTKSDIWPTWNPEPPYVLLHNPMNTSALVYKTEAFRKAGINDKSVDYGLEDYGSIISLLTSGYRGVVLTEANFNYRIRPDSMYRSLTRYKAMYSHQYISAKYPELYRYYASEIFSLVNANGPSFAYDNPSFGIRVTSTVIGNSGLMNNLKMFVKRNPALKKVLLQARSMIKR
ncbi:MAG: glycosyltransferase family 2 protein, partial [Chitinophagaceae bacterium]